MRLFNEKKSYSAVEILTSDQWAQAMYEYLRKYRNIEPAKYVIDLEFNLDKSVKVSLEKKE